MKKFKLLFVLMLCMFVCVGCGETKSENKEENTSGGDSAEVIRSKKNGYADLGQKFIYPVRNKVNEGRYYKFYSTETLYLIPVGNDTNSSCVKLETSANSPFSDKWAFAYVGVTYDGEGYNYYFVAEDSKGYGIPISSSNDLINYGGTLVYEEALTDHTSNVLREVYNIHNKNVIDNASVDSLLTAVKKTKVVIVTAPNCSNN